MLTDLMGSYSPGKVITMKPQILHLIAVLTFSLSLVEFSPTFSAESGIDPDVLARINAMIGSRIDIITVGGRKLDSMRLLEARKSSTGGSLLLRIENVSGKAQTIALAGVSQIVSGKEVIKINAPAAVKPRPVPAGRAPPEPAFSLNKDIDLDVEGVLVLMEPKYDELRGRIKRITRQHVVHFEHTHPGAGQPVTDAFPPGTILRVHRGRESEELRRPHEDLAEYKFYALAYNPGKRCYEGACLYYTEAKVASLIFGAFTGGDVEGDGKYSRRADAATVEDVVTQWKASDQSGTHLSYRNGQRRMEYTYTPVSAAIKRRLAAADAPNDKQKEPRRSLDDPYEDEPETLIRCRRLIESNREVIMVLAQPSVLTSADEHNRCFLRMYLPLTDAQVVSYRFHWLPNSRMLPSSIWFTMDLDFHFSGNGEYEHCALRGYLSDKPFVLTDQAIGWLKRKLADENGGQARELLDRGNPRAKEILDAYLRNQ